MTTLLGGIWLEVTRLLSWRRWAAAAAVLGAVGWVLADRLASLHATNQWDLPLDVLSDVPVVMFVLVPLFIGIVGDVVLADRWTGFAFLSLPRSRSRVRWWFAKIVAVLVAGLAFAVLFVVVLAAFGALRLGTGATLSAYGRTSLESGSGTFGLMAKSYDPPPLASVPALGVLVESLYTSLALAAFSLVILAVSQRWPKPWTPLLIAGPAMLFAYRTPATTVLDPALHLFWATHTFASNITVEWWASAFFIGGEVVLALAIGAAVLSGTDIA
jgi:hypothetical protein